MTIVIALEKNVYERLYNLKDDINVVLEENETMKFDIETKEKEIVDLKDSLDTKYKEYFDLQKKLKLSYLDNLKLTLKIEEYSKKIVDYDSHLTKNFNNENAKRLKAHWLLKAKNIQNAANENNDS